MSITNQANTYVCDLCTQHEIASVLPRGWAFSLHRYADSIAWTGPPSTHYCDKCRGAITGAIAETEKRRRGINA